MQISMNDGLGYEFTGSIDENLVKQTWDKIANDGSVEEIDDLCDQWPCLAITGTVTQVKAWLVELFDLGSVSGIEENMVWSITK